jgi:hypothetical protein
MRAVYIRFTNYFYAGIAELHVMTAFLLSVTKLQSIKQLEAAAVCRKEWQGFVGMVNGELTPNTALSIRQENYMSTDSVTPKPEKLPGARKRQPPTQAETQGPSGGWSRARPHEVRRSRSKQLIL